MTKAHVKSVTWWTEFLILHKEECMPQEKRTFQTERTRNELKEKKKIEYMDLDERIKQRLKEPNEITTICYHRKHRVQFTNFAVGRSRRRL